MLVCSLCGSIMHQYCTLLPCIILAYHLDTLPMMIIDLVDDGALARVVEGPQKRSGIVYAKHMSFWICHCFLRTRTMGTVGAHAPWEESVNAQ